MAFGPALMWKMGGDTSGFTKAVSSAETRTGKFKTVLKSIGPAFSVGLIIAGLQRLTSEMDATAKTARKLGVGAEFLQEMRYAADRTGVAQNALDMGLQRFTRRMAEAAAGGGELKGVLDEYNISVQNADGSTRSNIDVLGDLADVIKNTKDPAEQLRIAFKAFDSEGAAMVNTLRDGREGLDALRKAARDTGGVVGSETLGQFEKLSDQIGTLESSTKAMVGTLVGSFLSFGEKIGYVAGEIVYGFENIPPAVEATEPSMQAAAINIDAVSDSVERLRDVTEQLRSIDQIYADYDFSRLSAAEQLVQLQEEYNALNEKALTTTLSSAEGLELHRNIALKYVQIKELEQAQAEAIETAETEAATAAQVRAAAYINIAGSAEAAVAAAAAIASAEQAASDAAWSRYNANMKSVQIGTGGDNPETLSTEKLQYLLAEQQSELRSLETQNPGNNPFKIGDAFVKAGIQSFINQIETELETRRTYESLQGSAALGLAFDPFQIERLSAVTTEQSDSQVSNQLLQDIDDKLARQLARTTVY